MSHLNSFDAAASNFKRAFLTPSEARPDGIGPQSRILPLLQLKLVARDASDHNPIRWVIVATLSLIKSLYILRRLLPCGEKQPIHTLATHAGDLV